MPIQPMNFAGIEPRQHPVAAALQNAFNTYNQGVKSRYLPLNMQAEAASKLAYANLMAPQFLAKILNNPSALANLSEDQKRNVLDTVSSAGTNAGAANFGSLNSGISSLLSSKQGMPPSMRPAISTPFAVSGERQLPMAPQRDMSGLSKGPTDMLPGKGGSQQIQSIVQELQKPKKTYAENAAEFEGIIKEGKEAGGIRAKDIKGLNDIVFNAQTKQSTLDDINNMISSPPIREIRQLPLAGRHEMSYYAKFGTPAQQQLVGRIYAQLGNIVKDSARDFAGQFRKGEQQLLQGMKPNDGDTIDAMIGKAESLSVMNKMLMQRAQLTSQIMEKNHISKGAAEMQADKMISGDKIRQEVHDKLNPTVMVRNRKTGVTKKVSIEEARSLGVPNV